MKNLVVVIASMFLFQLAGISQDALTIFHEEIAGSWQWVRTETAGRSDANWVTPELCSCSKAITITKDGKYQYFENGKLINNESFTLLMNSADPNVVTFFFLGGQINLGVYLTKQHELKFGSPAGCGDIIVYQRK